MSFLFADKPSGINTHSSDLGLPSLVQYIERAKGIKLYPSQRLDKSTSGALILPTSKDSATILTSILKDKKLEKTYFFLSSQKRTLKEKKLDNEDGLSIFNYEKTLGPYFLYKVTPITGKTHQIRKQAKHLGVPILGDIKYAGPNFFRLMLHCFSIKAENFEHHAALPPYFCDANLDKNIDFWKIYLSIEQRQKIFEQSPKPVSSLRLIHKENADFHLDQLNDIYVFSVYSNQLKKQYFIDLVERLKNYFPIHKYIIREMFNRGSEANKKNIYLYPNSINSWQASELNWKFICKAGEGTSPGIFLDQRQNRNWIYQNSKNKKVLNLFCYTSIFSLCAALGEAKQITSVDISARYLEWSKENFKANQLNPDDYSFVKMSSLEYLNYAKKKSLQFDTIICDPPSFSRDQKRIFKIEKDYEHLIHRCLEVLKPNGHLLFSSNFEKWDKKTFCEKLNTNFNVLKTICPDPDFELDGLNPRLKSFIITH